MFSFIIRLVLLSVSVLALEAFSNAAPFDELSKRDFTLNKRQVYAPNTTSCGQGGTCVEACGLNQVECASSNPWVLYCHSSTDNSTCCPDGSSCHVGFWCSSQGSKSFYCCANSINASDCAHQYALQGSSNSASSAPAISPSKTSSSLAATFVSAPFVPTLTPASASSFPSPNTSYGQFNATATGSIIPQFTGGSPKVMESGFALIAGVAVLILL